MSSLWNCLTVLSWLILALAVAAERSVTVVSTDPLIQYTTTTDAGPYNNNSWAQQLNSQCSTQMLTTRIGDSVRFSFLGTSVQINGTMGVKAGILQFNVDGTDYPPFSRASKSLICNAQIFKSPVLPYGQHVVSAILAAEERDLSKNETIVFDSVLSIQYIIYTTKASSPSNLGPIIGGAVGGVVFAVLAAVLIVCWFKRKTRQLRALRGPAHASFDDEPGVPAMTGPPAGLIATPFPWSGPGSQFAHENRPLMDPNSPSPSSPSFPPVAFARTHSSSNSTDLKRESMGSHAASSFGLANPDDNSRSGGSRRQDAQLVDQIAHRVADIMHSRVGVMDQMVPPPLYDDDSSSRKEVATKRRSSTASPP